MRRLVSLIGLLWLLTGCASYSKALQATQEYCAARQCKGCIFAEYRGGRGNIRLVATTGEVPLDACLGRP